MNQFSRPKVELTNRVIDSFNVASIQGLINGQARLHTTRFNGNIENLQNHFKEDQLRAGTNQSTRLLNGFMASWDFKPIAYMMYYPAFDQYGRFGYYGEDIYVDDEFRHAGVGLRLLSHFAQEALKNQACFLEWVTDNRNENFKKFAKRRMGAERSQKMNFDGSGLIKALPFDAMEDNRYVTRPIKEGDGENLSKLGVNAQLADHSEETTFVGFITLHKETGTPAAATVANLRYSTFQTNWGMITEPTMFAPHIRNGQKLMVMKSILSGIHDYCQKSRESDLAIHSVNIYISSQDKEAVRYAFKSFGLQYDRIAEDRRSKMLPYYIDRTNLKALAKKADYQQGDRRSYSFDSNKTPGIVETSPAPGMSFSL